MESCNDARAAADKLPAQAARFRRETSPSWLSRPASRCRISIGAKEQALLTKLSYDFSRLGVEGVCAWLGRVNPSTKSGVPDENEFNTDLQWRPKWNFLNGFSVRFRYIRVHQYQGPKDNQDDFRLIINYDFP